MKIAVLSDGAWGTAIALLLLKNGHGVTQWGPFRDHIDEMLETRKNNRFLKGQDLPDDLLLTNSMSTAIANAELIVLATPTQFTRKTLTELFQSGFSDHQILLNVAKGIEIGTLKRVSELCDEIIPGSRYAVLSGPSHAEEVVHSVPTAVVTAAASPETAETIQDVFMNDVFRVYTSDDVVGVELGGALKNVYAIAAGICDGMELGDNSKAALITRGIAELARIGRFLGGREETFSGLSGVGDMIVTCASRHSRNRFVGEELGKGAALDEIIKKMGMVVAEGVTTTDSAHALARKIGIESPIIDEVYAGLYQGKDLRQGVRDLMTRRAKAETD